MFPGHFRNGSFGARVTPAGAEEGVPDGKFVFGVLNADRNSQWRFRAWINSSEWTMVSETDFTKLVFNCTCEFKLLVMPARLSSERLSSLTRRLRFVSVFATRELAFVNADAIWSGPPGGSSQLPSAPGPCSCFESVARFSAAGFMLAVTASKLEVT